MIHNLSAAFFGDKWSVRLEALSSLSSDSMAEQKKQQKNGFLGCVGISKGAEGTWLRDRKVWCSHSKCSRGQANEGWEISKIAWGRWVEMPVLAGEPKIKKKAKNETKLK